MIAIDWYFLPDLRTDLTATGKHVFESDAALKEIKTQSYFLLGGRVNYLYHKYKTIKATTKDYSVTIDIRNYGLKKNGEERNKNLQNITTCLKHLKIGLKENLQT